jgi:membrane protein implicated in regulation of membrane protease activity
VTAFRRYILFQVPGWLLAGVALACLYRWADLPLWAAGALQLVWMAKDFALYPWLRAAYEVDTRTHAEQRLVGRHAVATEPLAPRGYVRLHGELWLAEVDASGDGIGVGTTVEIVGASGITLTVREAPAHERPDGGPDRSGSTA